MFHHTYLLAREAVFTRLSCDPCGQELISKIQAVKIRVYLFTGITYKDKLLKDMT